VLFLSTFQHHPGSPALDQACLSTPEQISTIHRRKNTPL